MKKRILIGLIVSLIICQSISLAGCADEKIAEKETVALIHDKEDDNQSEIPEETETITESSIENDTELSLQTNEVMLPTPSTAGQLKVVGTKLCDKVGNVVQLRGVSTHGLAWFPDYVNNDLFAELRNEWGANVVRLALYTHEYGGYCAGGDQEALKQIVDNGVNYATDNDLYVIVDWHVLNEGNPNTYKDTALVFWDEISEKYADYDNVIYEICNEPCYGTSWSDIKAYANEIIPTIRANDSNAVILVGTPNWSQDVDMVAEDPITGYENLMYTLHFYAATHKEDLQNKLESAVSDGLPIFVSEYGICDASGNGAIDVESANKWVEMLDDNDISYVCWNLSNKDESSALISSGCTKKNGFTYDDLSEEGRWLLDTLK